MSTENTSKAKPIGLFQHILTLRGARTALLVIPSLLIGALAQTLWVSSPRLSAEQERAINEHVARDSAYVRESVNQLAERVGDLQAKLVRLDSTAQLVVEHSGLAHTDPELLSAMIDDADSERNSDGRLAAWTAESLGRELDLLNKRLNEQQDWFAAVDSVLADRQGYIALMPTIYPVEGARVSSLFGWRQHPITGRSTLHQGVDFSAPVGTPIVAASGGLVTEARYLPGYGKMVEISHGNGVATRYAHASSLLVRLGEVVEKGQMIARVGRTGQATGAHLHFEVRLAGQPVDPMLFLSTENEANKRGAQSTTEELSD